MVCAPVTGSLGESILEYIVSPVSVFFFLKKAYKGWSGLTVILKDGRAGPSPESSVASAGSESSCRIEDTERLRVYANIVERVNRKVGTRECLHNRAERCIVLVG